LLHMAILDAADFLGARANYAHEVLALLICEGSATVLVTNYDDCIERSAPQRLTVIWSPTAKDSWMCHTSRQPASNE
jgi:hypothetical protein